MTPFLTEVVIVVLRCAAEGGRVAAMTAGAPIRPARR